MLARISVAVGFLFVFYGPVWLARQGGSGRRGLRNQSEVDAYTAGFVLGCLAIGLFRGFVADDFPSSFVGPAMLAVYFVVFRLPVLLPGELPARIRAGFPTTRGRTIYAIGFVLGNATLLAGVKLL